MGPPEHSAPANAPDFLQLFDTAENASIGPEPRPSRRPAQEIQRWFDAAGTWTGARIADRQSLLAAALLWHDHAEEAHHIVQALPDRTASWLHGILHRREPDYANARYWFHKTAAHPALSQLAARAEPILNAAPAGSRLRRLAAGGTWDPFEFIGLCESATERRDLPLLGTLEAIQALEFRTLASHLTTGG